MSWLKAHIVKERARGMREEVKIQLLNMDDSPIDLEREPDKLWVQMTQAEYDALSVKDPNLLYVIIG